MYPDSEKSQGTTPKQEPWVRWEWQFAPEVFSGGLVQSHPFSDAEAETIKVKVTRLANFRSRSEHVEGFKGPFQHLQGLDAGATLARAGRTLCGELTERVFSFLDQQGKRCQAPGT